MSSLASPLRSHPLFPLSLSKRKPISTSSAKYLNVALMLTPDSDHYGPSLRRGQPPTPFGTYGDDSDSDHCSSFDRKSFSRTFSVAALRVPVSDCSAIEDRLRGHLLNWPRVRNIARIPGDDIDPDIGNLLRNADGDGGQRLLSLARRPLSESDFHTEDLSPVLYRAKLAKEFNYRGFLKFRNLARISRPKKKKKAEGEGVRGNNRERKSDYTVVEILGDEEEEDDDMSGLLGAEFCAGRWRGSTRLLLLDERHADRGFDDLPMAVKAQALLGVCKGTCLGAPGAHRPPQPCWA
ncbi:tRNA (guanine(37)-N1)-methyltransferase 2 [Platanthera guangdongensis]|uniref:tRNA (Guanine(37)-N1)-methyltransferase 2 n=1 Tax=Platanthera guangdongensis TaxID=2320717 RepID=A0ABR2N024_9ASPA